MIRKACRPYRFRTAAAARARREAIAGAGYLACILLVFAAYLGSFVMVDALMRDRSVAQSLAVWGL